MKRSEDLTKIGWLWIPWLAWVVFFPVMMDLGYISAPLMLLGMFIAFVLFSLIAEEKVGKK